jgi:hypothetical protein
MFHLGIKADKGLPRPRSFSASYRIIEFVRAFPALSEACDFSCAEGMREPNKLNQ